MPTWTSNIPSQVRTFANLSSFPVTGSIKTIYIAEDTDIAYYWTGSTYAPISIQDLSGLFPNPTGTTSQYIRGDGSLATFPSIPDVTGLQSKPVVVSSNITAQNDTVYHVVANATFTDPTGVNGKGYVVLLVNGNFSFFSGGGTFTQRGTIVCRMFHSGAWYTIIHDERAYNANNYVPQSRTINGLDLTANRTLTTANINDSTDRRYVTNAQLTVIGNTSGTNTGDQDLSGLVPNTRTINGLDLTTNRTLTAADVGAPSGSGTSTGTNTGDENQSSILSKLGWIRRLQKGGTVTGTTAETIVHTFSFTVNEYPASAILHVESQFVRTATPANNGTIRFRIHTSNTIVGSTLIGQASIGGNTNLFSQPRRKFDIEAGLIQGIVPNSSLITDIVTTTSTPLSASLDTTANWWLFVTYQPNNSGDTAICNFTEVKNF